MSVSAHIFSAVENGPRGDGGLSDDELRSVENGLFLCRQHHKIIDSKAESNKYTSDILSQLKYRHELGVSAEIGEYLYPLNWINSCEIVESPVWSSSVKINFGKVTHVFGHNDTGKSSFVEVIESCFSQKAHWRWDNSTIRMNITMDNPVARNFTSKLENGTVSYDINDSTFPFSPYDI